jgi:hypothetical protein
VAVTGTADDPGTALGYSLVLPPGWVQIRLDDRADEVVRGLVDQAFADVPPDVPPDTLASVRRRLDGHLTSTFAAARSTGATDLYLPAQRLGGVLVPASFAVAEHVHHLDGDGQTSEDVVARLLARLIAADETARAVEIDGAPGVRTESRAAGDPARQLGVEAATRQVAYVLSAPGRSGRWTTVTCTVLEAVDDTDDVAGLLVELFDAVMTTFRWTGA